MSGVKLYDPNCPNCDNTNTLGYCPSCRADIDNDTSCPECGTNTEDPTRYCCSACDADLDAIECVNCGDTEVYTFRKREANSMKVDAMCDQIDGCGYAHATQWVPLEEHEQDMTIGQTAMKAVRVAQRHQ